MRWKIIFDNDFESWFFAQDEDFQDEALAALRVLERRGPMLGRPRVDTVKGSRFPNMKELRVQFHGDPYRLLFAFDPERHAVVLVGGNKAGKKRWYKDNIPVADKRYQKHLDTSGLEGGKDG